MFDRRQIMLNAWANYRRAIAAQARMRAEGQRAPTIEGRALFANCLRTAWHTAKAEARDAYLASLPPEPLSPAADELLILENKTRWQPRDYQRASQLRRSLAA